MLEVSGGDAAAAAAARLVVGPFAQQELAEPQPQALLADAGRTVEEIRMRGPVVPDRARQITAHGLVAVHGVDAFHVSVPASGAS